MLKPRPTPYFEVYWFSPVPLVGFKALSLLHKPKQILIHTIPDVFFFFKEHICFHLLNPPTLNLLFQAQLIK